MTFWQRLKNGIANFLLQGLPPQDQEFKEERKAYKEYNEKFFGGKLPRNIRFEWVLDDEVQADVYGGKKAPCMRFNPKVAWSGNWQRCLMLHEMCHIAVWPKRSHGPVWWAEMERIWREGAFRGIL